MPMQIVFVSIRIDQPSTEEGCVGALISLVLLRKLSAIFGNSSATKFELSIFNVIFETYIKYLSFKSII
jgi:hypothetical protein